MTTAPPALAGLGNIDWDDTGSILAGCTPAFDAIASTPAVLDDLLETLLADPRLQAMCERYDFLDKLVLHDMPDVGVRIRLHLYRDGYYDRPHNHRWSFASRILSASTATGSSGPMTPSPRTPTPPRSGPSASAPRPPGPPTPCTTPASTRYKPATARSRC